MKPEARIVRAEDRAEEADSRSGFQGGICHFFSDHLKGLVKGRLDLGEQTGAASNVILGVVRVDNREAIMLFICECRDLVLYGSTLATHVRESDGVCCDTDLGDVLGRVEANRHLLVVKFVAVEIQEVHKEISQMMHRVHITTLNLWHHLQHTHNETYD